jgi:hypothetical protein
VQLGRREDHEDLKSVIVKSNEITIVVLPREPPFSISISAKPDVVKVGQRIAIDIVLTNLSDHSLDTPSTWIAGFDMVYGFDVRDSAGTQLPWKPPPTVAGIDGMKSGTLDPGKTKVEQVLIDEFYDLTKPGIYMIQVRRYDTENPRGHLAPKQDVTKGEVTSNKIALTVLPATPATPR